MGNTINRGGKNILRKSWREYMTLSRSKQDSESRQHSKGNLKDEVIEKKSTELKQLESDIQWLETCHWELID